MKQIIAVPAFVACPECGIALMQTRDMKENVKQGFVRFYHAPSMVAVCQHDLASLDINVQEFLIPRGGDSHGQG